ncbi:tripartite tricarboxylate transporter TctB family protein [Roseivivax sp. CAU 1761]
MTGRSQDTVLATALLALAGVWTWLVVATIPPGLDAVGPRSFPLAFGLMLLVLSGLLLLRALTAPADPADPSEPGPGEGAMAPARWITLGLVTAEIVAYAMLMKYIGFVLATPLLVLAVMVVNLRDFSPKRILLTAGGITLGCWLIFEKGLGIYLANGIWINLG